MMQPFWADTDSQVIALPFGTTAVPLAIMSGDGVLLGYSLLESTGSAVAQVDIVDGYDANGTLLAAIALNAGQSVRDDFGTFGVSISRGLFLWVRAGSIRGAVFLIRK